MRILFISTFYPPHVVGGWEQLVQDINGRLQKRGHTTHVLTSIHVVQEPTHEKGVDRVLTLESDLYHYKPVDFLTHKRRLENNLHHTEAVIDRFKPDVIFVHVMFNLSWGIPWVAEKRLPGRVVYYVANDWPHAPDPHTAYWRDPAGNPVMSAAKKLLAPVPLRIIAQENERFSLEFEHVLCVSNAVKKDLAQNANIDPAAMQVVYNGVNTDRFSPANGTVKVRRKKEGLSLLYAGSLVPHKGVHTAIEAMAHLAQQNKLGNMTLTIVGGGHPDYEARLRKIVDVANLNDAVTFRGRVPREEMPSLLQAFDVLLFPSIWEEPLARMMQEGMAAGLVVIGTLTGGSGELLVEGETGLTFTPDDPVSLAQRIKELDRDSELFTRLSRNGRQAVIEKFDIRRMIDEIEAYLGQVAATPAPTVN